MIGIWASNRLTELLGRRLPLSDQASKLENLVGTIPAGRVSDYAWAHWDILPTLADLAGARVPDGLDGKSMTRALRGESQSPHDPFYWEFHERGFQQAVRMGKWKAVRLAPGKPLELYDLDADPRETHDVAAGNAAIVEQVETYLKTARTPSARWPDGVR